MDWRAMFVFIGAAIAVPLNESPIWIEILIRLIIPSIGGVVWVFLKPIIIKWKNNIK